MEDSKICIETPITWTRNKQPRSVPNSQRTHWSSSIGHTTICHELAIFLLFFYLFLFFSFSFGTYLTSCSNRTLNPAYSCPWHTLPMAYSSIPILFCFAPQWAFCYWLAFYLVTFRSTYVIDVPFYYILHMYLSATSENNPRLVN